MKSGVIGEVFPSKGGWCYICATFINMADRDIWKIIEIRGPESLEEILVETFHLIPCPGKAKKELSLACSIAKFAGVFAVGVYCLAVLRDLW